MITKKHLIENGYNLSNVISEQKIPKDFSEIVSLLLHSRTQVHTLHL
ncbi:MAG: hypothetical protein RLZ10_1878, partial [Bacteroidota bacterium]